MHNPASSELQSTLLFGSRLLATDLSSNGRDAHRKTVGKGRHDQAHPPYNYIHVCMYVCMYVCIYIYIYNNYFYISLHSAPAYPLCHARVLAKAFRAYFY